MSDFTAKPRHTAVFGMTGSGKTTFIFDYMRKSPVVCRFIFDDQGQASARLKIPLSSTPAEMERALATRWMLYNPHIMFPGDEQAGFDFFCDWVFQTCKRGHGWKQVCADEVWRFQNRDKMPKPLAVLSQMGRVEGIELITGTQQPHKVNDSITGGATFMVCFRMDESVHLRKVRELGGPVDIIQNLPLGSFVQVNRITKQVTRGKMF